MSTTSGSRTGDVYALDADDATYDVVHAHQVLQHLGDPIAALREARAGPDARAALLAVRDSDYGAFFWSPPDPRLDRWLQLYHHVTQRNGAQADAGRWLPLWVRQAGFTGIDVTSTTWTFADAESRAWWGGLWAERVRSTALAEQAVEYGFSTEAELDDLGAAFERWAADPDAVFVVSPRRGDRPRTRVTFGRGSPRTRVQSSASGSSPSSSGSSSSAPTDLSSRTSTSPSPSA